MITTDFIHGSPCWMDLGAPDVENAVGFYGAVMEWTFEPYEGAANGYGAFSKDGRTVGGVGELTEDGARSAWTLYFNTPDAEATAAAARQLGGTVRAAPADAAEMGRLAQLSDPQGGRFAVWQPGKDQGFELADVPGSLCWTELYTTDAAGAKAFYGELFGWTGTDIPMPGDEPGTYSILTPAGGDDNRMHGGLMELPPEVLSLTGGTAYWHPVFTVDDTDETVARVTANGGSIQMGPENGPGVGRLAVCLDPDGADFVVLKPEA
ncbi:VOC family protein [Streptantibioticus silvisoli]|uniref:VOC family protein n=1 Tax=Streptantibioticus silvisoli TaxID=2705255 RepID=A0ABT6VYY5_9ACTN|nr:VOC family protein [Streptantibioticus silvisoli]MDI5963703.1 VOC family protein [Streptantibioticus silvisoli]